MPFPFSFHLHIEGVRAIRERGAGESLEERKFGKVFGWRSQRKGSPARFLVGDQRYCWSCIVSTITLEKVLGDMDQPITGIDTTLLLELDMDSLPRNKHELTVVLEDVTSNMYIVIRGANEPSLNELELEPELKNKPV
ncbi:hypothetical protein Hanom_Chr17g01550451 [Helianthus anomalus]